MTQTDFIGYTKTEIDQLAFEIATRGCDILCETIRGEDFVNSVGGLMTFMEAIKAVNEINPIRLDDMLHGRKEDIIHDLCGMLQYYDWSTNQLTECWTPRYSA